MPTGMSTDTSVKLRCFFFFGAGWGLGQVAFYGPQDHQDTVVLGHSIAFDKVKIQDVSLVAPLNMHILVKTNWLHS